MGQNIASWVCSLRTNLLAFCLPMFYSQSRDHDPADFYNHLQGKSRKKLHRIRPGAMLFLIYTSNPLKLFAPSYWLVVSRLAPNRRYGCVLERSFSDALLVIKASRENLSARRQDESAQFFAYLRIHNTHV